MIHSTAIIGKGTKIQPTAIIEENCEIGNDCFVGHFVVLRPNTKIGDRTVIGHLTVSEGDNSIGSDCLIHAQCHITRGALIEDKVFIAPGFIGANDPEMVHMRRKGKDFIPKGYHIKHGARLAIGVLVAPGVTIGSNAIIGIGSVIAKDVADNEIVYGQRAQTRGVVPESDRI
jgi:acetyltransferase-like isoleucine patch superfamily enzyme